MAGTLSPVAVPLKECIEPTCRTLHRGTGSRCATCKQAKERQRPPRPTTFGRDWTERQRRAAAVAHHRATHGEWCPGYERPAHNSSDLTADHVTPVAAGGHPAGDLAVLCRPCNSRKAAH